MKLKPEKEPSKNSIRITMTSEKAIPATLPPPAESDTSEPRFIDTSDSVKSEEPDESAVFQGAENTMALSSSPPKNNSVLPNLSGTRIDTLDLNTRKHTQDSSKKPESPEQNKPQIKQEPQVQITDAENAANSTRKGEKLSFATDPSAILTTNDFDEKTNKTMPIQERKSQSPKNSQSPSDYASFSAEKNKGLIAGGAPLANDASFGANQTELGRYKDKLYRAIGSRWYVYVEESSGFISIGKVKIRFYVRSDGVFEKLELISGDRSDQLYVISRRSIIENSGQLEPFSEAMREQLGEGYWEEISFTIR